MVYQVAARRMEFHLDAHGAIPDGMLPGSPANYANFVERHQNKTIMRSPTLVPYDIIHV
jgi:hypothetical protein